MRVFFAIEFDEPIKEYLYEIQNELREHCRGGNYTHKENFHLTLRFMGEQDQKQIEQLKAVLDNTAREMKEFQLWLGKPGCFDRGSKKIIWLGLQKSGELQALYNRLEEQLQSSGYPKEGRLYRPHITLVRETRSDDFNETASKIKTRGFPVRVKFISLMESTRIDNKLTYLTVEICRLI